MISKHHIFEKQIMKDLICGIIVLPFGSYSEEIDSELKEQIHVKHSELQTDIFYDEETNLLTIILYGMQLKDTHYFSLFLKQYLQERSMLNGDMLIASFPESGESFEQIIGQMYQRFGVGKGKGKIQIITKQMKMKSNKVLIIDSDETVTRFISTRLKMKGFTVYTARDGEEGLRLFETYLPDLVITELAVPVISGYQIIQKIKKQHRFELECSIFVLTDKRLEEDVDRAFELGVSDYMTKPFSLTELEARLKKVYK